MIKEGSFYVVTPVAPGLRTSYPLKEVPPGTIVKALEDAPQGSLDVIDVLHPNGNVLSVYSFQLMKKESRGRGWHKEQKRHQEAALKGLRGRGGVVAPPERGRTGQNLEAVKPYSDYSRGHDYIHFKAMPASVAKKLLTGNPNADPDDYVNYSPTIRRMVRLAEMHGGTLEGYAIPVESGRDDARIDFDGFSLPVSLAKAQKIIQQERQEDESQRVRKPDELYEIPGGVRLWWD